MSNRLAAETTELQQERLAAETTEERAARLQQMSELQQERLAAETTEERVARLQRMSERQRERLAAETTDERAARLQHDQGSHRGAQSDLPLFEQPAVRARMCKFHAQDALLVQKHSLVFSFAHSLLSACVVAETSTHQSCILLLTTRTLALCHLSYRLDRLPASCHTSVLGVKVSDFFPHVGFNTSRGDVNLCCVAYHAPLPLASWTVWL